MTHLGIILAGGRGTRLYPATLAVSKQLLAVYDKPMIYYPLSTLMDSGLRDILVITTPEQQPQFQALLGQGGGWGIRLRYAAQPRPEGIAQALLLARPFLSGQGCTLILGDNLFYGPALGEQLRAARARAGATIFTYPVRDPQRYGVVQFGADGHPTALLEKPAVPPSDQAVTGLYVYDDQAPALAAQLRPSARGELEITDLNAAYLRAGRLQVQRLERGYAWLDAGTHDSLLAASGFVQTLEQRQALTLGSPEETAYRQGWIGRAELRRAAEQLGDSPYAARLRELLAAPARPAAQKVAQEKRGDP